MVSRSRSTSTTASRWSHGLLSTVVWSIRKMSRPRVTRPSFCACGSGVTNSVTSLMTVPCSLSAASAVVAARIMHSVSSVRFSVNILTLFNEHAINGNLLFQFVDQVQRARLPVALRILAGNLLGQRRGFFACRVALRAVILNAIDVCQRSLPPCGVVERLSSLGGLRMLVRVLLVQRCFFLRTLGLPAPLLAQLAIEQVIFCKLRLLRLRKLRNH